MPNALVATTVKVYDVPFVRPVKLQVSALTVVQLAGGPEDGVEVTE
jgi:hypothetical protein